MGGPQASSVWQPIHKCHRPKPASSHNPSPIPQPTPSPAQRLVGCKVVAQRARDVDDALLHRGAVDEHTCLQHRQLGAAHCKANAGESKGSQVRLGQGWDKEGYVNQDGIRCTAFAS